MRPLAAAAMAAMLALLPAPPARAQDRRDAPPPRPRGLVLVIADGTGWQQWTLLLAARRAAGRTEPTNFERMIRAGTLGAVTTWPADDVVGDSASTATALATGGKTRNGAVAAALDGQPLRNLVEVAASSGIRSGVVTTTDVTDATPAAFLAHAVSRGDQDGIAARILESPADVVLGGGARWFVPRGRDTSLAGDFGPGVPPSRSLRRDDRDLLGEMPAFGKSLVPRKELHVLPRGAVGLLAPAEIPYAIDRDTPEERALVHCPSLPEMADGALGSLRRMAGDDGRFLLVIESGMVDRACHAMDAGTALAEMEELDALLGLLLERRASAPDMLVVLTADHETGGLSVTLPSAGAPSRERLRLLAAQTASFSSLPGARAGAAGGPAPLEKARGIAPWLPDGARPFTDPGEDGRGGDFTGKYGVAWAEAASRAAGVTFATDSHSATPVPVVAVGPGAERFRGLLDNAEAGETLRRLLLGE